MMKKNGFTLAEVLITLSIIGVVAALTLPSLNMGVQSSKVGPSLRKFINTMSNANEMILARRQSNSLRGVYTSDQVTDYLGFLAGFVRGAASDFDVDAAVRANPNEDARTIRAYNGGNLPADFTPNNWQVFHLDSGEDMAINLRALENQQRDVAAPGHRGIFADVLYDLDGFNSGANRLGIDLFLFRLDNNGTLIPAGGTTEANSGYTTDENGNSNGIGWSVGNDLCNSGDGNVGTGINCAGSVIDNNGRVIYRY